MQGLIGVTRIYLKYAAILLATGLLFALAALHSGAQDEPKRPRITGIDHIRLYVSDLRKSREFYAKLVGVIPFGSACIERSRPCFTVGGGFQAVELEQAGAHPHRNWVAEIALRTDDVGQMRRYLIAHGMNASEIQKGASDGYAHNPHFEVTDPEGTSISFIQRIAYPPDGFPRGINLDTQLLHAGFVVKDMTAENKFYRDLLGFKLYWQGGMKDDGVDWYELQVPDGDNWIEYMLNIPSTADHKALGAQNHFSFGVKEIEAAAAQLRKNGVEKIAGPGIGRDGKRGLNVYDPDDTRVEVTEFTPAREPCCHPYTAAHPTP